MYIRKVELAKFSFIIVTFVLNILIYTGSAFGQTVGTTSDTMPTEPWYNKIKDDVEKAVRLSANDPVSSFLTFQSVIEQGKDSLSQTQKGWLSAKVENLRTPALKILQSDFDQSSKSNDLRTAIIAKTVADKIDKESIITQPSMTELKNKVFVGSTNNSSFWAVSDVGTKFIDGPYQEGGFVLNPKEGFHFLRLTASVTNTSKFADKSYTLWALDDVKRIIATITNKHDENKSPYLWLDGGFIYLLTPASDLVPCVHVCNGCDLYGTMSFSVSDKDGNGIIITGPQIIDYGKKMGIDLLFSVPKGINEYRLLVLGSPPIKLKIIPTGQPIK